MEGERDFNKKKEEKDNSMKVMKGKIERKKPGQGNERKKSVKMNSTASTSTKT